VKDSLLHYFGESEISFDEFLIKTPSGLVTKDGEAVKLEPQVLTFLLLLIRHKDHIVSRDEITAEVWAGKKASDDAIRALVKKLRSALGDNARSPKFVKTVPLKGYLFIMPVQVKCHEADWWRSKSVIYSASVVLIILVTLFVQSQFGTFQRTPESNKRKVVISSIAQMKGTEVSPYLSKNDRLLYSHRDANEKSLQLYIKNLNSSSTKRLTWDEADYTKGILSADASQAIATRRTNNKESLMLFELDKNSQLIKASSIQLDDTFGTQKVSAISYSQNGNSLYVIAENNDGLGEPIKTKSSGMVVEDTELIRYDLASKMANTISFKIPIGAEVLDAKDSNSSQYLALLISNGQHTDMHVFDLEMKETKFVKRLPLGANSFVWAPDDKSITFTTKSGELLNLNLSRQRIYRWDGLIGKVREVISQCGDDCFVIKERQEELVKLVERPLPFNEAAYMSANQFSLKSNDRFPSYFNKGGGIYFLSLVGKSLQLVRFTEEKGLEAIYDLPSTSDIQSFVLSPDEKRFAGELDGRIFVYDIGMATLSFLSSGSQKSTRPVWASSDVLFYQQTVDGSSVVYAHDVISNKVSIKAQGLLLLKPLSDKQWLLVDEQKQAYLYEETAAGDEGGANIFNVEMLTNAKQFASFDSVSDNDIVVVNNVLYFLSRASKQPTLNKLDLHSGELESRELDMLSVLPQLDIHPELQKMLLVETSIAQSNLLKIEGLALTTRQVNQVLTETP
jgi:DNA-binding winged helix-turn-helix (wHTH) protein